MNYDIEINNLTLKYGNLTVLDKLNLSLQSGKIYGLIGRNGAGKTSLLTLLASFQLPTSGSIKIAGEEPFENARIMAEVTFAYQIDLSEESYTVNDYFYDALRYRPNFDLDYAQTLAKRFDFPLDKPIKNLSSGKQSAINATLGLASRSAVTIFDEIYVNMDAPTRKIFYQEIIEDQAKYPRLMILSTHLVSEMDYLLDHVLILDQGKLMIDEDFESVINRGFTVTGPVDAVDQFVSNKQQLSSQQLGQTKAVMIYGEIADSERIQAQQAGLELGPVSLQELFIHLTEKEANDE
ncbi:ATP-binding cassette domain-containing protein [Amphibacillus sediminis]|uniref:ATP-binding cassette domain-containing protein n=1 Tax=Amphibacillus sediminis TaxID=360185 RepID=UPI00082950A4|nr:ABC transporter ATP-binding protein [Amphibacillus sediminis]